MDNTIIDILKGAILLEMRGKSFYETVAKETKSEATKEIFEIMAGEEVVHVNFLAEQYKSYTQTGKFSKIELTDYKHNDVSENVLTETLKNQITAASYEAAAIAAAISMEKKAIDYYSQRANLSVNEDEKKLYKFLSEWETEHLRLLENLDKELVEKAWNDNQFWPY